jgi:hypothetical protein
MKAGEVGFAVLVLVAIAMSPLVGRTGRESWGRQPGAGRSIRMSVEQARRSVFREVADRRRRLGQRRRWSRQRSDDARAHPCGQRQGQQQDFEERRGSATEAGRRAGSSAPAAARLVDLILVKEGSACGPACEP